ncbi:cell division control protein Cdc6 [Myriangium duriaei CBS 260.36]|uniref:Cell division control protein n=1 Tax=Myriangium duriaei CBS 260.36 TaxID=1168546 RepID=A0A9P4J8P8_9PEZI|nr:cell division control protein Cdc6 [Myriangium duriaei CBS 260.36]
MASILGKRTRCVDTSTTTGPRAKRVSRHIQVHSDANISSDENQEPLSVTKSAACDLASFNISTPSKAADARVSRPAKHGKPATRTSKGINAHFRAAKTNVEDSDAVKKAVVITPPITPRHRDAAANKAPVTPQNRVRVPGSVLTPRTPTTPTTISKANPYAQARQAFTGGSEQISLVGREQERSQVTEFISTHLQSATGGCLYVSGPPGTGKSAFVSDIIQHLDLASKTKHAVINCMSIKTATELAENLATSLEIATSGKKKIDAITLKGHFSGQTANATISLLVLDEIDQLVELDLKLLYSLFEWSMQPKSNLILIGIANALDLTDRLLPRLKSRNVKPSLLPFMPYTAPQINDIITARLRTLNTSTSDPTFVPFLHPAAILLCSKKVASQTGDLRKAFDIVKRALSLAEAEARLSHSSTPSKTPLSENVNLASPPITSLTQTKLTSSLIHLTPETAPRATIAHVAKVTSQIFSNGMSSRLAQLNIQQKAVLCTLSSLEKRARSALANALSSMMQFVPSTPSKSGRGQSQSPTIKQLYDSYAELCRRENLLHALSSVEFRDVLSGLETLSLIEFVDGSGRGTLGLMTPTRTPSRKGKKADFGQMGLGAVGSDDRKVAGVVGFVELRDSLTGPGSDILREILEG